MIQKGFTYYAPLQKTLDVQFDGRVWKKVMKQYDKKNYKQSFLEILKYANKNILKKHKVSAGKFHIPHGSIFVDIEINDKEINVTSSFLNVANANKVPLYRRVAELNFSGLNIEQIKLHGDELRFEYTCPLETYEPYKVFEALGNICYFADQYDDQFIEDFNATEIQEGDTKAVSAKEAGKAWTNYKAILKYSLETIEELEKERKNDVVWDVLQITFKSIDAAFSPQGTMMLRLRQEISKLASQGTSFTDAVYKGKEYLRELDEMSQEDFTANLYSAQIFIPHKRVSSDEAISEYLKPGYSDAYNLVQSGSHEDAYYMVTHVLYNVLFFHMVSKGMEKTIRRILKKYSATKMDKKPAMNILEDVREVITGEGIDKHYSGFWGILLAIIFFVLGAFFN